MSTITALAALATATLLTSQVSAQGCSEFNLQVLDRNGNITFPSQHTRVSDAVLCTTDTEDSERYSNGRCPVQAQGYATYAIQINNTAFHANQTDGDGDIEAIRASLDAFFETVGVPADRANISGIATDQTLAADPQPADQPDGRPLYSYAMFTPVFDCYLGLFHDCEAGFLDESDVVRLCLPRFEEREFDGIPSFEGNVWIAVTDALEEGDDELANPNAEMDDDWEAGFSRFMEGGSGGDDGGGDDGDDGDQDSSGSALGFKPSGLLSLGVAWLLVVSMA
ncbi:hypothetical protein MBLNU230_g5744t1 [Neophaeotheca triangularis]